MMDNKLTKFNTTKTFGSLLKVTMQVLIPIWSLSRRCFTLRVQNRLLMLFLTHPDRSTQLASFLLQRIRNNPTWSKLKKTKKMSLLKSALKLWVNILVTIFSNKKSRQWSTDCFSSIKFTNKTEHKAERTLKIGKPKESRWLIKSPRRLPKEWKVEKALLIKGFTSNIKSRWCKENFFFKNNKGKPRKMLNLKLTQLALNLCRGQNKELT